MRLAVLTTIFLALLGCASGGGTYMVPDSDEEPNNARGPAYAGEGMLYRKPQPDRRDPRQYQFFYKNCWVDSENGLPYISKRVYACNDSF